MAEIEYTKKDAQYYMGLFNEARAYVGNRVEELTELGAFYEGKQSKLKRYSAKLPWVINMNSPYASDAIDIRVASLQANDYCGELEPLSPLDTQNIELLNRVVQNFWKEMRMNQLIDEALGVASVLREAYIHVVYDSEKSYGGRERKRTGVLDAYLIDPSSILLDPRALSLKTSDYIIVVEEITRRQYKALYGKKEAPQGGDLSPDEMGRIFVDDDGKADDKLSKLTFYEREDTSIYRTVVISGKIVGERTEFPIDCYPIAQFRWYKAFKSPYGISLMDRLLPLQKSVNSIESATTNTALQFASPSFILKKNNGVDPKAFSKVIGAPGVVIAVDSDVNNAVAPLIKNALDQQLIEVGRKNEATIYKIAGVTEAFQGTYGTAGNTRSGAISAENRAKIMENKILTNLAEFTEDLVEILVKFIVGVFAGDTIYTRSPRRSDGTYQFNEIVIPEDIEDIKYTYYVNLEVKTPSSKEKTKILLQELFQMENQYQVPVKTLTMLDIIKTYDLPNKDEIVERYNKLLTQDNETKSQVIIQWVSVAEQYGLDTAIITQGIMEILEGNETPTVDAGLAQVEQIITQQEAQAQQLAQQEAMLANMPQEVTGDEVFGEEAVTGDEEFNLG